MTTQAAVLDWNRTSRDYLEHRPGYPHKFFELLAHLGIGLRGQVILDLGAGTGALSVPFAQQGCRVVAVDAAAKQLDSAKEAARRAGVSLETLVSRAEQTGLPSQSFDVVSAAMCWGYFDLDLISSEVKRLLRPGGVLLVASLIWIPDGPIASRSNDLVRQFNPAAQMRPRGAPREAVPAWSVGRFRVKTFHTEVLDLEFTRESWRGRHRASKWIDAALAPEQAAAFDRAHTDLLASIAPERFSIAHTVTLHVLEPEPPSL